jgi:hypothetical protein
MSLDVTNITVLMTESAFSTAGSGSPPTITSINSAGQRRGVSFWWKTVLYPAPFYYQFRYKVESESWSSWEDTDEDHITLYIDSATVDSYGTAPTIYLEVRVSDGVTTGPVSEINDQCIPGDWRSEEMEDIDEDALGSDLISRMFTSSDRSLDDCSESDTRKFAAESNADVTANNTAGDTTLVNGEAAATVKTGAANGQTAYTKINSEVGSNTIETTMGSQNKVDSRLSTAEKSALETALGVALAILDGTDNIIIGPGTHENLTANATAIKTLLALNNVENKSSATIRGEIVLSDIPTTIQRVSELITKINLSTETPKISSSQIAEILATQVLVSVGGANLFDSSGRVLIGVSTGGSHRTTQNIIDAITSGGRAQNLDLSSIANGNLDSIPETGSDRTVTANEKLGAARAYLGLNSSGNLVYDVEYSSGKTKSAYEIYAAVRATRIIWTADELDNSGITDFTEQTVTGSGVGTPKYFRAFTFRKEEMDENLVVEYPISPGDTLGSLKLIVNTATGVIVPGVTDSEAMPSATGYDNIKVQLDISSLADDTTYQCLVGIDGTNAVGYKVKGGIAYMTFTPIIS